MNGHLSIGRARQVVIVVIVLVGIASAALAAGRLENVTVVTTEGWKYVNMAIEYEPGQPNVTLINSEGARKELPRARVASVVDAAGNDITVATLGPGAAASPPPGGVPAAAAPPPVAAPPAASPGTLFMPSFEAGFGSVSGDWFEGFTSGPSVGVGLRIFAGRQFNIGASYRYQKLGVESIYEVLDGIPVEWDVSLQEYMVMFGLNSPRGRPLRPLVYLECGFGMIGHHIEVRATGTPVSASDTQNKFGMEIGVGGVLPAGTSFAFRLGGTLRVTGTGGTSTTNGSSGVVFGAQAGIVLLLGG